MPELPDVTVYVEALSERMVGKDIVQARVLVPFVLRTAKPPFASVVGRRVESVERLSKRVAFCLDGDLAMVVHLMIAGRFRWIQRESAPPARISLACWDVEDGRLVLTEASKKRRASVHIVDSARLDDFRPIGIDPLTAQVDEFAAALTRESRTLKRALTSPRIVAGIGNAYSDEILFEARLSPVKLTRSLDHDQIARLHGATQRVLTDWTERLREEFRGRFPGAGEVTAFRPDFAVHGRFGQPCRVCGKPVQRIRYADNETNYCAVCQNDGVILADRSLSRLLKGDWPRSFEDEPDST